MEFVVGQQVRIAARFYGSDGALTDPTAVTLQVKKGNADASTVSTSNPSTGLYQADVSLDAAGDWRYDFVATGDVVAVIEGSFRVKPRVIQG